MKLKLTSILLCLSLLCTGGLLTSCAQQPHAPSDPAPHEPAPRVMYIPLDNRPINDQQVRLLAGSLGIELLMPDTGIYATAIDGATNAAGLQYGDRAAILEWMMAQADSCDTIIVYLDQLLSGGLMNSRCMDALRAVTLSDGREFTEFQIIDYIASLAETHTVYVIDSQLRLATSNDYLGFTLNDYDIGRAYGLVPRQSYTEGMTPEQIIAGYPLAADGSDAIYQADLTPEQIDYFLDGGDSSPLALYHAIRERKFLLNVYAMETLYGLENIRYFFGVDDSASGSNIQGAEYAYLNMLAGGALENLSAIDCLGELAVSCAFREYCGNTDVAVTVRYYGSDDNNLTYAGHTVSEAVTQILRFSGATAVTENADVEILVACDSTDEADTRAASDAMIAQMKKNFSKKVPTIYIDFASKTNTDMLTKVDISMLLSAGLHANGSGASAIMGISQGLARYRALQLENYLTEDCHRAFIEDLTFMFAKGYYWKSEQKAAMGAYLAELGLNPSNMTGISAEQLTQINTELTNRINTNSKNILSSLKNGKFITSLAPYDTSRVKSVSITNCSYPWSRTFEFTSEFTVILK